MKTGVVTDSACDLPPEYIDQHHIRIMPINLLLGNDLFIDTRDPDNTMEFYRRYINDKDMQGETRPYSVEQIVRLFLDELILHYNRVLIVTISRTRSRIFDNALAASFGVLEGYRARRRQADLRGSFYLDVLDSKTLFTGEAILVHEAIRLLEDESLPLGKIKCALNELSDHVYAYLVPNDLYYIHSRGSKKGDNSVGAFCYRVGSMLDLKPIIACHQGEARALSKERGFERALAELFKRARKAIDGGLKTQVVAMSYAGHPDVIRHRDDFVDFEDYARGKGIEVMLSVMSATAGINVGPGAVSLAYAA